MNYELLLLQLFTTNVDLQFLTVNRTLLQDPYRNSSTRYVSMNTLSHEMLGPPQND